MNKANVRRLSLALLAGTLAKPSGRRKPIGFNMIPWVFKPEEHPATASGGYPDHTGHNCGTVACMAGWAYALDGGKLGKASERGTIINKRAQKFLGIGPLMADDLFAPDFAIRAKATHRDAALVLFNLAETGKVDWRIAGYQ